MLFNLIRIQEFPEQATIADIEWLAVGRVNGQAWKISFDNFKTQFVPSAMTPTFTDSSFDI